METMEQSWVSLVEECLVATTMKGGHQSVECDFGASWDKYSHVGPTASELEGSWVVRAPTRPWTEIVAVKEEVVEQLVDGIAVSDADTLTEPMEEEEEQQREDPDTRTNLRRRSRMAAEAVLKSPCECCPITGFEPDPNLTKKQQRQQVEEKVHFRLFHGIKIFFQYRWVQSEMSRDATMRRMERVKGDKRSGQGVAGEEWLGAQERLGVSKVGWRDLKKEKRNSFRRRVEGKYRKKPGSVRRRERAQRARELGQGGEASKQLPVSSQPPEQKGKLAVTFSTGSSETRSAKVFVRPVDRAATSKRESAMEASTPSTPSSSRQKPREITPSRGSSTSSATAASSRAPSWASSTPSRSRRRSPIESSAPSSSSTPRPKAASPIRWRSSSTRDLDSSGSSKRQDSSRGERQESSRGSRDSASRVKSQVVAVASSTRSSKEQHHRHHEDKRKKSSRPYVVNSGNRKRDKEIERDVDEALRADAERKKEKKEQRERLQRELDRCRRVNEEVGKVTERVVNDGTEGGSSMEVDDGSCRVSVPPPSEINQNWGGPASAAEGETPPIVVHMEENQLRDCKNVSIDDVDDPEGQMVTATFQDDSKLTYRPKDIEKLDAYVRKFGGDPTSLTDILTVAGFLVEKEEEEMEKKKQDRMKRKERSEQAKEAWEKGEPEVTEFNCKRNVVADHSD